jgi:hypothetical protein
MTPNRKYGAIETPIHLLEMATFDCALPELVLTLRMSSPTTQLAFEHLALDVYHLVVALSDYEKTLGGRGLRLVEKAADDTTITLHVVPVLEPEALERLQRLVELLNNATQNGPAQHQTGGSLREALERTASSVRERFRLAVARRDWKIECQIAD